MARGSARPCFQPCGIRRRFPTALTPSCHEDCAPSAPLLPEPGGTSIDPSRVRLGRVCPASGPTQGVDRDSALALQHLLNLKRGPPVGNESQVLGNSVLDCFSSNARAVDPRSAHRAFRFPPHVSALLNRYVRSYSHPRFPVWHSDCHQIPATSR